jgi:hypothetical protein
MNEQSSIQLHIEELVLHGFAPGDRYRIGDAVETELRRLLAGQLPSSFRQNSEIDHLDGGEFKVTSGATPEAIGGHVAESVHRTVVSPDSTPQQRGT